MDVYGQAISEPRAGLPTLFEAYKQLAALEVETTKLRHTTFTAILSISFVLPGLALRPEVEAHAAISIPWLTAVTLSQAVFLLGFVFYLFSLFHYAWHHRYSHCYRKRLKELEQQLGIEIYRLRIRPQIGSMKLHFDWALHTIGIIYAAVTISYVGAMPFVAAMSAMAGMYLIRMLLSVFQADEPLER